MSWQTFLESIRFAYPEMYRKYSEQPLKDLLRYAEPLPTDKKRGKKS